MLVNKTLIKNILDSKLFFGLLTKASLVINKNKKLTTIAMAALKKVIHNRDLKEVGLSFFKQIKLLSKMIYFYANGQYKEVSKKSIILTVAAVSYFVLPIDLLPDFILGLGYLDDISLVGYVFSTLALEINQFEMWLKKYGSAESIAFTEI